jgi:hypothetical protein
MDLDVPEDLDQPAHGALRGQVSEGSKNRHVLLDRHLLGPTLDLVEDRLLTGDNHVASPLLERASMSGW